MVNKKPNKQCLECGKPFYKPPCLARIKFCCDACYRMNRRKWKFSDEWKKNISEAVKKNLPSTVFKKGQRASRATEFKKGENLGINHHAWKGDSAGYIALHSWVHRHKSKPSKCPYCDEEKSLHAHNLSGEYKRELSDWLYLCQNCHAKLHKIKNNKTEIKKCEWCNKEFESYKTRPQRFCSINCVRRKERKNGKNKGEK